MPNSTVVKYVTIAILKASGAVIAASDEDAIARLNYVIQTAQTIKSMLINASSDVTKS